MEEVISSRLYDLRMKKAITQESLASELGVTRQTVIAIEKGHYTPSVLLALKVAHFFRVSVRLCCAYRLTVYQRYRQRVGEVSSGADTFYYRHTALHDHELGLSLSLEKVQHEHVRRAYR